MREGSESHEVEMRDGGSLKEGEKGGKRVGQGTGVKRRGKTAGQGTG